MNDDYNGMASRAGNATPRYSRSEGITSYRRRRRRNRLAKTLTVLVLLAIIGSAGVLFGRQFFEQLPVPSSGGAQPEAAEGAAAEAVPDPQPTEISIVCSGDVILNSAVVESGRTETGTYDFSHLFAPLAKELEHFDLRMVSQESALAGSKFGYGYSNPLNAPQDLGRSEVEAGFNTVLRATDHTLDTGFEGIHNELSWWHSEFPDVPVLGVSEPEITVYPHLTDYVDNVYIYQKEGFKVAVLNHSWGIEGEERGAVSSLDEEKATEDVRKAKELGANMIVACAHWGAENDQNIVDEQTEFAKLYADLGVDVIIGTHPRVLQPVSVLENSKGHKTVCYYSLGCLISSLNTQNMVGGLAEVRLVRNPDGSCAVTSAELKPVVTHRGSGEDFATYLLGDYTDELAYSSRDGSLTPERISQSCKEILGDSYDEGRHVLVVDLAKTEKV